MNISIEISYYPLNEDYISAVKDFIGRLKKHEGLTIKSNKMSTQVFGEYYMVMKAITDEICRSFELPHSIFVMKIVNADLTPS